MANNKPNSQKLFYSEEVSQNNNMQNASSNNMQNASSNNMQNFNNNYMGNDSGEGNTIDKTVMSSNYNYEMQQMNGNNYNNQNTLNDSYHNQNDGYDNSNYNKNYNNGNLKIQRQEDAKKDKKERNWVINTGNMSIIAGGLSIIIDVVHKLLRMLLVAYSGVIVFLYILAGILSVFALFACVKNGLKNKQITLDAYITGISFVTLILI